MLKETPRKAFRKPGELLFKSTFNKLEEKRKKKSGYYEAKK